MSNQTPFGHTTTRSTKLTYPSPAIDINQRPKLFSRLRQNSSNRSVRDTVLTTCSKGLSPLLTTTTSSLRTIAQSSPSFGKTAYCGNTPPASLTDYASHNRWWLTSSRSFMGPSTTDTKLSFTACNVFTSPKGPNYSNSLWKHAPNALC